MSNTLKDWRTGTSMKERYASVFKKKLFSDVSFTVGKEQKQICANKTILSVTSSVFETMFNERSSDFNVIEVPEIQPAAFEELLRFCYCEEIKLTQQIVWEIMYAADKYFIDGIKEKCFDFFKDTISPSNALSVLREAKLHKEESIIQLCLKMIDTQTSFLDIHNIDEDTLSLILERDMLEASEVNLFQAVARWTETECKRKNLPLTPENKQFVAKNVLSLIRFPLISLQEFIEEVPSSGMMSSEDQLALLLFYNKVNEPPAKYNAKPRAFDCHNMPTLSQKNTKPQMDSQKSQESDKVTKNHPDTANPVLKTKTLGFDSVSKDAHHMPVFSASLNGAAHGKKVNPKKTKDNRTILITNVPLDLLVDDIRSYFAHYGSIIKTYRPHDTKNDEVTYCFITFRSEDAVIEVLKSSEHWIKGKNLYVERPAPRKDSGFYGRNQSQS